jgi:hypothetical protein
LGEAAAALGLAETVGFLTEETRGDALVEAAAAFGEAAETFGEAAEDFLAEAEEARGGIFFFFFKSCDLKIDE